MTGRSTNASASCGSSVRSAAAPLEPVHPRVAAEPGVLTAREALGGAHGLGPRLVLGALPGERREHLLVAERPRGRTPLAQPLRLQCAHLVHQSGLPHPVDPPGDALVELGPRHVDADLDGVVDGVVAREVGGEGPAGDLDHLEGADDAAAVARQDRLGGLGVGGGEPGVQRAGAAQRELLLQPGADLGVGAGELQGVDGPADVEPGAADQDRRSGPRRAGASISRAGQPLVLGDAGGDR